MFYIRSTRRTVDSKIDENRCKQKYELIQVMGILNSYITLTATIHLLKRCMARSNKFEIAPDSHVHYASGIISEP